MAVLNRSCVKLEGVKSGPDCITKTILLSVTMNEVIPSSRSRLVLTQINFRVTNNGETALEMESCNGCSKSGTPVNPWRASNRAWFRKQNFEVGIYYLYTIQNIV